MWLFAEDAFLSVHKRHKIRQKIEIHKRHKIGKKECGYSRRMASVSPQKTRNKTKVEAGANAPECLSMISPTNCRRGWSSSSTTSRAGRRGWCIMSRRRWSIWRHRCGRSSAAIWRRTHKRHKTGQKMSPQNTQNKTKREPEKMQTN